MSDWYSTEAPENLLIYNVLTQQVSGAPADQDSAADWHESLALSFDVLADVEGEWQFYWGGSMGTSQHSYTVVDSTGRVFWRVDNGQQAPLEDIIAAAESVE